MFMKIVDLGPPSQIVDLGRENKTLRDTHVKVCDGCPGGIAVDDQQS